MRAPHLLMQQTGVWALSPCVWSWEGLSVGNLLAGGWDDLGFLASESDTCVSFVFLDRDDFNIQVLHAFVGLHEFTDLNLVQALR